MTRKDIEEKKDAGARALWSHAIREDSTSKTWVAVSGRVIVGFAGAKRSQDRNQVTCLYVLPQCHRRGIGNALMKAALTWLGEDKEIFLEVVTYNEGAIQLYQKFGFTLGKPIVNECGMLPSGKIFPEVEMIRTV